MVTLSERNADWGRRLCDPREGKARNEESRWKHDEQTSAEEFSSSKLRTIASICHAMDDAHIYRRWASCHYIPCAMNIYPKRMVATDVGDDDASKDRGNARLRRSYAARNAHCLETRLTPCALIRGVIVSANENKYDSCTNYSDTLSRKLRAF